MNKVIPVTLSKDYYFAIYNSSAVEMEEDYKEVLRSNFRADDEYIQKVESVYKNTAIQSHTVLIKSKEGNCVGGGTVSIRK